MNPRGGAAGGEESAHNTHAAIFDEVKIDEQLGVIRVTRSSVRCRGEYPEHQEREQPDRRVSGVSDGAHEETLLADHRAGRNA